MTSIAARKKSIAGPGGAMLQIDVNLVTNTLLNKAGSSTVPLYQQCAQLRANLLRIHDFAPYLSPALTSGTASATRQSTDPVHQLWDCLALGIPLCFLFNLLPLPASARIDINTDPADLNPDDVKAKKKAIIHFLMGINTLRKAGQWDEWEQFNVSELLDSERNTNGFVKVVNTVSQLIQRLPPHVFMDEDVPLSPTTSGNPESPQENRPCDTSGYPPLTFPPPANAQEADRQQVLKELIITERKYVQDLEVMQAYASALGKDGIMDQDTIHHLFPQLNQLLDFQRHFLIALEGVVEQPWPQQRWGHAFTSMEQGFVVYEPYCANYTSASELLQVEEQNLMVLSHVIHPKSELPAFLIKPVQRICKYPLLLESLVKRTSVKEYPYYDELLEGVAAAKRITDRVNEAQRRAENELIVKALELRVEDWKGHHLSNFGRLLLDDIFVVNKAEVDREYHVFLFEKIILCCKEAVVGSGSSRKSSKTSSLLKKGPGSVSGSPLVNMGAAGRRKMTPLLLKGRIFLNNVTSATPNRKDPYQHSLQVWWRGDDELEFFTLRCRGEELMKQWETSINRLIKENASRRAVEKSVSSIGSKSSVSVSSSPSTTDLPAYSHEKKFSFAEAHRPPPYSAFSQSALSSRYGTPSGAFPDGPDSEYFSQQPMDERVRIAMASAYPASGRGTPNGTAPGGRRAGATASMPPERDAVPGYDRVRARTEDQNGTVLSQFRSHGSVLPPAPNGPLPPIPKTAPLQRGVSEANYGQQTRSLKSQFSSTKLRHAYESGEEQTYHPYSSSAQQHQRSRSSSNPAVHKLSRDDHPPPLPSGHSGWMSASGSMSSLTSVERKRGSGSSQSYQSSDDSGAQSTSPVTPYGSNDSSLANTTIRPMQSQVFTGEKGITGVLPGAITFSPPIKVRVHYGEDLFVIVVPRTTDYAELVDKLGRKIRLCGGRKDDAPLRVKYRDEDGDLISLGSNEDVQMAFDTGVKSQVTLYVV
ncbi:hypothetical protein BOTBODRAFT_50042 [Botryobasidium botryosum FD-172 SS1]|uniref:DH domain-containing protein n=1 Tax=Botryobasidium botryosum (strain FD-172 SS1) TaxID=930990 RepID=A0A067NBB7_BOTB1|nr:hypothetical protein BOTBODRAFT_50042 [Botryobasidium botryosum FD-172 SS1]